VNPPEDLSWLITAFADRVPAVAHAAIVSPGGLPLACSYGLPGDQMDQLAAVASGLASLVQGVARLFQGGPAAQTVVVMEQGVLILKLIGDTSVLAVLAAPECDLGLVSYEMALLGEQAGRVLTPEARHAPGPGVIDQPVQWAVPRGTVP
jgi:hypothetical protein